MITRLVDASSICVPLKFHKHGSDEMFMGRAGYLTAVQSTIRVLGRGSPVEAPVRQQLCEATLKSGLSSDSPFHESGQCPLMFAYYGQEYLGNSLLFSLLNIKPPKRSNQFWS